jgi:hypothetical protein
VVALVVAAATIALDARQLPPQPSPGPPPTPRASAPIDLVGYWVSIVNEDWRWRMVTPAKGDYPGINLTPAGRKLADSWDTALDGSCKAYGAGALMRMPTRVHITWEGDTALKIETDAGQQTRHLRFGPRPPAVGARTLQGYSVANWERTLPPANAFGFAGPPVRTMGGALKAVTTNLQGAWLRRNGVPYSDNATVTEYFDRFPAPDNTEWFVVTTIVEDPAYLAAPFTTSSHFRREPDGSKWAPSPCKAG